MKQMNKEALLNEGKRVLSLEAEAIAAAAENLDENFVAAVQFIHTQLKDGAKIIVTGVGKSGNVAQKLAATLTSTGSMAVFLHPTDALHGDLGIIGPKDIFLLFSHSGSTEEILQILPSVKELCNKIIAVVGNKEGVLTKYANIVIHANIPKEACPNNLAPTTSSTLQMAIGDALAICLQQLHGFNEEHYARLHPGGALGKRLHTKVEGLMHSGSKMACLEPSAKMEDVVIALTNFRQSGVCIIEGKTKTGLPKLVGIITEGDLRRALFAKEKFFNLKAAEIMTKSPITISPEMKAYEALKVMENRDPQLSFLPVVDDSNGCIGIIRLHDLVLAGLS